MLLVEAEYVLGIAAFWSGELDAARRHFEAAVARSRPEHRHAHLLRYATGYQSDLLEPPGEYTVVPRPSRGGGTGARRGARAGR